MADSDFWKALAVEFRSIDDPMRILEAHWTNFEGPRWELIRGDFVTLSAQYEPLARRGGRKLDPTRESLEVWLESMRREGYALADIAKVETDEVIACRISALCQRSADFCNLLESRALETERIAENEEQQRDDPRNWSPLQQHWELFKLMKSTTATPSEEIPETLVRSALAKQYGVKPEEVTQEQIQFEVAGLLPYYPSITVIPSQTVDAEMLPKESVLEVEQTHKGCTRSGEVSAFLKRCNELSDITIYKRHIWQSVGHARGRQFEYWQECNEAKTTEADRRNFSRILREGPERFLAALKRKGLIEDI